MIDDDPADDAAEPPPMFDLSSPATGRFRRARSIEAAATAGVAYSVLTVVALIRLSRFPDLSVGEAELTAWYDDDAHQVWLIGALSLAAVGSIAFLWFVAVIRRRLGDREDRFFATVFLSSGIVYVAVWLVGAGALPRWSHLSVSSGSGSRSVTGASPPAPCCCSSPTSCPSSWQEAECWPSWA
jgi:hypothetical protein